MKLLIIDAGGNALDFSVLAGAAGHSVKHFIRQTEKTKHIGRGLVDIVDDFQPWLFWSDLVFFADNIKYLAEISKLREHGTPIIGPSPETALWELDRDIGMKVFKAAGIPTPPSKEFNDYDAAIKYVKDRMCRLVSKPSGDADKALSYCSKSPEDMVYMLERWKKSAKIKAPFILQDFVAGIEMAVGGWFGPHGFNRGWCENFEFKKFMDGDMGVATGEQGTVLRYVDRSKLAKLVLSPLTDMLLESGYCGYIDVNCIIDEDGDPWPLEFTMRPGWPTFNIQQPLHKGDPVEWLIQLASGKDARNILLDTVSLGVVLSIPDYPYSHLTRKEVIGVPIYGLGDARIRRHVHLCETMLGEAPTEIGGKIVTSPHIVTAGDYVLVMTAVGETVWDAKRTAYRRLKALTLPNSPMYRTDIGDRLSRQLPKLQEKGYAMGMIFSISPTD